MVMHKGNVRLFDADLAGQLNDVANIKSGFSKFGINGADKYVYGDLPGLMRQIKSYYPGIVFPFETDS